MIKNFFNTNFLSKEIQKGGIKLSTFPKHEVAILTYHRVSDIQDNWSLNPIKIESFEKHLKFFIKKFNVISLEKLVNLINNKESIPPRTLVITFDDGYKDNYSNAYPLLKKYKVPATIFLTTNFIGNNDLLWHDKVGYIIRNSPMNKIKINGIGEYSLNSDLNRNKAIINIKQYLKNLKNIDMLPILENLAEICNVSVPAEIGADLMLSWDEVIEMSNNGIDFGAHTVNHSILTNVSLKEAKFEILESKKVIENNIQKEVKSFAYPNGNFSPFIIDILKNNGFECALALKQQLINIYNNDLYSLSRIDGLEDLFFLKLFLLGYGKYLIKLVNLKNKFTN